MVLTIDLTPELESRLREAAADHGVEPRVYVEEHLRQHLRPAGIPPSLNAAESRLFDEINHGFSESEWDRYRELLAKRTAEQLDEAERVELTTLSDSLERMNVRRLVLLSELAHLRNTTLPALMDQLGLQSGSVE